MDRAPLFRKPQAPASSAAPSSPAFGTPALPPKPFCAAAGKTAILPIILPPATLRPLAFRTFTKKHSLTLTSAALQELATFIGRHCGSGWREEGLGERVLEEAARAWRRRGGGVMVEGGKELQDILRALQGSMSGGRITVASSRLGEADVSGTADDAEEDEDSEEESGAGNSKDVGAWLKVVDAHEQPRLSYSIAKRQFERDTGRASLLPPASRRTAALRNRFHVIHQRLLRHDSFQASSVPSSRRASDRQQQGLPPSLEMTPVANLLGRHGSSHMLFGQLNVLPTGQVAVSDLTGTIALDVAQAVAVPADSAWFCPGMMVLVDGVYKEEDESVGKGLGGSSGVGGTLGGRFQAFFIGQPPCERRAVTLSGGGFGWVDFLGVGSERAVGAKMRRVERRLASPESSPRCRVVILGELALDQPRCLQALRKILSLYAAEPEGCSPVAFVLAGNFTTHAAMARARSGSIEYKECFDALASALADFPPLLQSSTFLFVPGDNDGWMSSFTAGASTPLPRKAVPDMFTSRVRRAFANAANTVPASASHHRGSAVWTSNPSRISLFGPNHEIVLFRDDLSARLRRNSITLKSQQQQQQQDPMQLDNHADQHQDKQDAEPSGDTRTARKLVKTVLDQGFLAPFRHSTRALHCDHASALHLYPLPTAMALIDTSAPPFAISYEGCHVMNPASLLVPGRKGVARWIEYQLGRVGTLRECSL